MHILVCDDDAAFAARMDEYISEWFRAREIQVQSTVCTSGEQLLATPELERYQLAFLDVDLKTTDMMLGKHSNGNPEIVLNFLTPHQKWGIHSTYSDNLRMLTLSRGGPHVWVSEADAKRAHLVDNDWVEVFNLNGTLTARVVVSQRIPDGVILMYHAQEKIVNVPGAEVSKKRGGIHNSVTRAVLKPTHMIGGYAQQSYGFNYYGTVGANRDEFVIVRKMDKVDWMDQPANLSSITA